MARRLCSFLISGALLAASTDAQADQPVITERLRLQGGYFTQSFPAPIARQDDLWIGAVPQLGLLWETRDSAVTVSYALTGALHSLQGLSEIAHAATAAGAFYLSQRTTLLIGAAATQSTLSNFLVSAPAVGTNITLLPSIGSRLVTARANQAMAYEASPNVRLEQSADAGVFTTLRPTPPLDTFFANVGLGAERSWRSDGLGVEVRGGYSVTVATPPLPDQKFFSVTAAPRWRRDWSPTFNSLVTAGATALFSPDPGTEPIYAPYGRASLLYTYAPTVFDLSFVTGVFPSLLTGQLLRSHQVSLRATTPVSLHHHVNIGASVGYLRASLLDLRNPNNDQDYDGALSDVDLTWQANAYVQFFARYQFLAQIADLTPTGLNPSFLRDQFFIGVTLSSRPDGADVVQSGFGQRVDQSDVRTNRRGDPNERDENGRRREDRDRDRENPETTPGAGAPPGSTRQNPGPSRWIYTTPARPAQPAQPGD
jgi:hypothetical protein